ncbi:hypothetical protein CLF_103053 [Clonorchis sinensis]|uniref:Uncharacterized protein n=1 Tax=Clonorchis sinensis TaxID=79923 RepID=G7Y8Z3_CLOSI|nr:hypothetical protein CLF_103053 [Clonorchis sinensis]
MTLDVASHVFVEKFGAAFFSSFTAFGKALNQYMKNGYVVFVRSFSIRCTNAVLRYEWPSGEFENSATLKTGTPEHAIQKVSRNAEWLVREFEMHTSYHCGRREILEGDGRFLDVVCQMTTYAWSVVLRRFGPRPPKLHYGSGGKNKSCLYSGCNLMIMSDSMIIHKLGINIIIIIATRSAKKAFYDADLDRSTDVSDQMNNPHEGVHALSGRKYVLIKTTDTTQLFMSSILDLFLGRDGRVCFLPKVAPEQKPERTNRRIVQTILWTHRGQQNTLSNFR